MRLSLTNPSIKFGHKCPEATEIFHSCRPTETHHFLVNWANNNRQPWCKSTDKHYRTIGTINKNACNKTHFRKFDKLSAKPRGPDASGGRHHQPAKTMQLFQCKNKYFRHRFHMENGIKLCTFYRTY